MISNRYQCFFLSPEGTKACRLGLLAPGNQTKNILKPQRGDRATTNFAFAPLGLKNSCGIKTWG